MITQPHLADKGEQSTHILKPIPLSRLRRVKEIPANENLTMQIASQVYGIEIAANGRSFEEFGKRIGIREKRVAEILADFTLQYPLTERLIEASFLLPDTKKTYWAEYRQRRNRLKDMK